VGTVKKTMETGSRTRLVRNVLHVCDGGVRRFVRTAPQAADRRAGQRADRAIAGSESALSFSAGRSSTARVPPGGTVQSGPPTTMNDEGLADAAAANPFSFTQTCGRRRNSWRAASGRANRQ
jgi:hypothetical protein